MLKLTLLATALTIVGALLVPPQVLSAERPSGIYRIPGRTPVFPGGHLVDPCYDASACGGKPLPRPMPPVGPGWTGCGVDRCVIDPLPGHIVPLNAD